MLPLPFSIQAFSRLRDLNCLYIDKTKYAYDLIIQEQSFFLSRPRRFGKSLFISTLEEILRGNKDLFAETWISKSNYTWPTYAVLSLDFTPIKTSNSTTVEQSLCRILLNVAQDYKIPFTSDLTNPNLDLVVLVKALHTIYGKVAILIDEYDHPILQSLHFPQLPEVLATLQSFFATIKSINKQINFLFITGVSAFAKAGIFSGMNNPKNLSLDPEFSGVCGYTEEELDHYFIPYFKDFAEKNNISLSNLRAEIKSRYNGYHFGQNVPAVYNPFSLIKALDSGKLQNFWFGSGTPTFLIEEIKKAYDKKAYDVFHLEEFKIGEDEPEYFDVTAIPLPALMFQTGYLTIKSFENGEYILGFPNLEVRTALQKHLLSILMNLDFPLTAQLSRDLSIDLNSENIEWIANALT